MEDVTIQTIKSTKEHLNYVHKGYVYTSVLGYKCLVLKVYRETWWKVVLNKLGFKFRVNCFKVKGFM